MSMTMEVFMGDEVRSKAGHVLATSDDKDARSVASYVLSGGEPVAPPVKRTREDLTRILAKIDGVEGQTERANAIRAQLEAMG
jgi:hypothetical protein